MVIDVTKPNIAQLIITISTFTLSKAVKIGAFTFGGGYAMLPLIQKEIV